MNIDYNNYIHCVLENCKLEASLWNFKSNIHYQTILEHVSFEEGIRYFESIEKEFQSVFFLNIKEICEFIEENDSLGNPIKYSYGNVIQCSPTNIRYIYHSLLILSYMKKLNLNNINIVEIGGGYGGLSYYLHKLSKYYDIVISTYSIFDLDYVSILQKEYLKQLNIQVDTYTLDDRFNLKNNSFLISNYAFSEISKPLQELYRTKVIPYCSHGFLVWNHIPLYNFVEHTITHETERPTTSKTDHKNLFVYF